MASKYSDLVIEKTSCYSKTKELAESIRLFGLMHGELVELSLLPPGQELIDRIKRTQSDFSSLSHTLGASLREAVEKSTIQLWESYKFDDSSVQTAEQIGTLTSQQLIYMIYRLSGRGDTVPAHYQKLGDFCGGMIPLADDQHRHGMIDWLTRRMWFEQRKRSTQSTQCTYCLKFGHAVGRCFKQRALMERSGSRHQYAG